MKKTIVIALSLVLGLALLATVALAWGPGFGPGFGPGLGRGPGRGFGGPAFGSPPIPNLTAEQSAEIQTLRDGYLKEVEPLQEQLYAKRQELRALWLTENPDQAAISAKQKEMADLQTQLRDKATNLGLEVRKALTSEQLAQLPAFSQSAGFSPGAGFGPRGFGPPMGMRGPFGR
jgi:zinc resistance-associated protein